MIPIDDMQAAAGKSTDADYRLSHIYWSKIVPDRLELMGVSGIGGCGLTEVLYRHFEELRHLRKIVAFDRQKTVLELGSGNGRWAISIAPLVKQYIAVDFSQQMLDLSRQRAENLHLDNISFCLASAQDFTPEMPVDVVYLSGVSQYLHDAELKALLVRLKPSLQPDVLLVDRSTIHRRQRLLSIQQGYFCIYRTAEELKQVFEEGGFLLHYRCRSYRFLNVPGIMGRLLSCSPSANVVSLTAPISFHLLRGVAWLSERIWGPTGELADYSHDFFIYNRGD